MKLPVNYGTIKCCIILFIIESLEASKFRKQSVVKESSVTGWHLFKSFRLHRNGGFLGDYN